MSDVREVFPILAGVSGEGIDVSQMQEGWSPTGKNGLIGFSFRDASGNVVLPMLTGDGKIPVSTQSPGTKLNARGEHAAGSLTEVTVTGAVIALTANKQYADLNLVCSSRRGALFQVIFDNNGSETVLVDAVVDAGEYTTGISLNDLVFTAGATGTQQLIVKAKNFDKESALRATIDILELA